MRTAVLFYNKRKPETRRWADRIRKILRRRKIRAVAEGERYEGADFAVAIGGDGTMLRAARVLAPHGIPLAGINTGGLGFLSGTEIEEVARDILREFEPDIAGRNIDWRIGDLPVLSGDEAMLRIVLVNLISNALKFTRPRKEARIEIGSLPGQASEAVVYVRDNGVGFDMTYVDKLFGVFQRLHRADEFEGTGIGLANVRRIINRHGGRTWAEGNIGEGAKFYFTLPRT